MKTLVLGIGNILLSDEGIGIHTLNYLRRHYADLKEVEYLDGGTLSFTLAPIIEEAQNLIVIDATQLHAEPGAIQTFIGKKMDEFLSTPRRSVHEVGLVDLLTMVRLTEHLPVRRALIGIQPQNLYWGDVPSPELASIIPQAASFVEQLVREWNE
jgi:hydrogenase maturation protease